MTGQNAQTSNSISPQKETKFNLTNASPEARQMVLKYFRLKLERKFQICSPKGWKCWRLNTVKYRYLGSYIPNILGI